MTGVARVCAVFVALVWLAVLSGCGSSGGSSGGVFDGGAGFGATGGSAGSGE